MQISDVPDLAHTRPRPIHWLATATAMAGVVALGGVLGPHEATASQSSAPATAAGPTQGRIPAPDPAAVTFPLECGGVGTVVVRKASGDLDGDGRPETVAAVRCDSGSGTPPSGVYVLTSGKGGAPRVVATLIAPAEQMSVGQDIAIRDEVVRATMLGYSGSGVPRCCPDEERHLSWKWANGAFVRSEGAESRSV